MIDKIFNEINDIEDEIIQLSKNIHQNPELCYEEHLSSAFIKDVLKKHGFTVENNSGGMKTAFKARFKGCCDGPVVAFLAEYDALPGIGHGCGHNLIAAVSTGAAIGLSKIMDKTGGEVVLMGTPAEEGGGGKITLLEQGEFDDIDYALMTHPSTQNLIGRGGLATTGMEITFRGVSAHSASPEDGVNALQGIIQTFNMIDAVRALLPLKANINGIITQGGTATNIIPDYAQCRLSVRAGSFGDLKIVVNRIKNAVAAAEKLTGAKSTIVIGRVYAERYPSLTIGEVFKTYMEKQGETINYPDPTAKIGSSDIGNVTLKIPAIHAYIKITDEKIASHSMDFTKASITNQAHVIALKAAKALACAGYEILVDENLRIEIQEEFDRKVPSYSAMNLE